MYSIDFTIRKYGMEKIGYCEKIKNAVFASVTDCEKESAK